MGAPQPLGAPAAPPTAPPPTSRKGGLPAWGWLAIAVALIGAVVGVIVLTSGDDDKKEIGSATTLTLPTDATVSPTTPDGTEPDVTITVPDDTEPDSTEPDDTVSAETVPGTPSDEEVPGAPEGQKGTAGSPVPAGAIADIGGGWRLQVLGFTPDATDQIMTEFDYNDPPPAGSAFTLVSVALGYFGVDDPKSSFSPFIAAVGSTGDDLSSMCGSIPDDLLSFRDMFSGGVLQGNLCFVTTEADRDGLQLRAIGDWFTDDIGVFLEPAQPASATSLAALKGPQDGAAFTPSRLDPNPVGTAGDVGENWSVTVTQAARDMTDEMLADTFNEPPPDGYLYLGVEMTYTFNGSGTDTAFTVSTHAVGDDNVSLGESCGFVPAPIDIFTDVASGGSVSGTVCFVAPTDTTGIVVYSQGGYDKTPVTFATS